MDSLFVTGGTGFVGSRLLPALERRGWPATALVRSAPRRPTPDRAGTLRMLRGDLLAPATYRTALTSASTVVHLAATTGRATAREHVLVNAVGTETLLRECQAAGVRRFLFVSSIAAGFPDRRDYPYAAAKVRAEEAVRRSTMAFTIVRPTMILGAGSGVLAGLAKLATLPVIPVFGDGRTIVQPVHVDDVVRAILEIINRDMFQNATYEIGGPETLPVEELLQRIRAARRGARARSLHVPVGLVRAPLRMAEAMGLTPVLPLTAGQLTTFRFAGVAGGNVLQDSLQRGMLPLAEMLAASSEAPAGSTPMLVRECRVFTLHLLGCPPEPDVVARYLDAHRVLPALSTSDPFEAAVIRFARRHRLAAAMADAYARLFLPAAVLRKKLVLLLAILETSASSHRHVDAPVAGPPVVVAVRLALRGMAAVMWLVAGVALFAPARLIFTARAR